MFSSDTLRRQRDAWSADSRLRLQTIVWLRWIAVLGQLAAVLVVWLFLRFPMPVGYCLGFVALSAWVNVALSVKYPAR
ncbi:MAG: sensor histidine kinase, partial [Hyphomicrobiaceae bacterium]